MERTVFSIFTLGCKVNQYESQRIARELLKLGFSVAKEGGDVFILNSCAVTHRAERKARQIIYRGKRAGKKVIVTGCVSPSLWESLKKDEQIILVPQERKMEIPRILREIFPPSIFSLNEEEATKKAIGRKRAFVSIQTGCDNFCSYCIVPYLRGKPKSRPPQDVLEEIRELLRLGFKEIVLCGIRLGKYGRDLEDNISLPSLLKEILNWGGDFRVRLSSIEPMDFDDELLLLASHPKLCPHFHIPLQSGSDRILKLMGRSYTVDYFLSLVKGIRKTVPLVNITTDVIVGFPSEGEGDFLQTLRLCEEVGFGKIHIFPFSARPGTKAEKWEDVPWEIKKERARVLRALEERLSLSYRRSLIGERLWVLFQGKRGDLWEGISHNYITCYAEEPTEGLCWCYGEGIFKDGIKVRLEKGGEENGAMCVLYDSKGRG
ncbi:MAG: tRNA (N(6)-L-threonylcarbamoyladenosine(37)-C(2))-methylthiotransferase MtaB [bacterium]